MDGTCAPSPSQGAILHAGQAAGDWALLEVMEPIMSKHVYYLGWDASFNNVQDLDSDSSMNQEGLLPYAVRSISLLETSSSLFS
eukprot:scaffold306_cov525-Prasinococcus_capsulatus_cf.AAC.50